MQTEKTPDTIEQQVKKEEHDNEIEDDTKKESKDAES
jgi:hypothetical protein